MYSFFTSALLFGVVLSLALLSSIQLQAGQPDRLVIALSELGVHHFQKYAPDSAEVAWNILVYQEESELFLKVSNAESGEELLNYANEFGISDAFISARVLTLTAYKNPVLLTLWNRGIHGERIVLFDPSLKTEKILLNETSAWPADIRFREDKIIVNLGRDMRAGKKGPEAILVWPESK